MKLRFIFSHNWFLANGRQLILDTLSNDRFLLKQLAGKRKGGTNRSRGVKAGANSLDVTLFSFWFNLINFCLSRVGVTTNTKKVDNPNTNTADADKPSISIVDIKKGEKVEANNANADRMDKPFTDIANSAKVDKIEVDRTDDLDISPADPANPVEANEVDNQGTRPANLADQVKVDGVDKQGTGTADLVNLVEAEVADKRGISIANLAKTEGVETYKAKAAGANKLDTGPAAKNLWRQPAKKQVKARASFFFFCQGACLFFSFLESETSGFYVISSTLCFVITFVKQDTLSSK